MPTVYIRPFNTLPGYAEIITFSPGTPPDRPMPGPNPPEPPLGIWGPPDPRPTPPIFWPGFPHWPPTSPPIPGEPIIPPLPINLPTQDPEGTGWVYCWVPGYGWMWAKVPQAEDVPPVQPPPQS